jgi:hypothetical protein
LPSLSGGLGEVQWVEEQSSRAPAEDRRLREDLSARTSEVQVFSPARSGRIIKSPLLAEKKILLQELSPAAASLAVSKEQFSSAMALQAQGQRLEEDLRQTHGGAGVEPGQIDFRERLWCRS